MDTCDRFDCHCPTRVTSDGVTTSHVDAQGRPHNTTGPDLERVHGYRRWRRHGRYHRSDGPAIETGLRAEWYLRGQRTTAEAVTRAWLAERAPETPVAEVTRILSRAEAWPYGSDLAIIHAGLPTPRGPERHPALYPPQYPAT